MKYDDMHNAMKDAMKAKDQQKVLLLRGIISAIKNATINAGKEMTDEAVDVALKKSIKELDQSIESFSKAGRDDDVAKLNQDKAYLQSMLPKQLSEDEAKALVEDVVKELNATSKKDMGKVMKAVMAKANGQTDGKTISSIVANILK